MSRRLRVGLVVAGMGVWYAIQRRPKAGAAIAGAGLLVSVLYSVLSIFPIIDVRDPGRFARKIVLTLAGTTAIGLAIYAAGRWKQRG